MSSALDPKLTVKLIKFLKAHANYWHSASEIATALKANSKEIYRRLLRMERVQGFDTGTLTRSDTGKFVAWSFVTVGSEYTPPPAPRKERKESPFKDTERAVEAVAALAASNQLYRQTLIHIKETIEAALKDITHD